MFTFHSDPINGRRATISGRVTEDNSRIELSAAVCSQGDQYNRKLGNKIARGRLTKGKVLDTIEVEGRPTSEVFVQSAIELATRVCSDYTQISG